jgi:hypothetical protein
MHSVARSLLSSIHSLKRLGRYSDPDKESDRQRQRVSGCVWPSCAHVTLRDEHMTKHMTELLAIYHSVSTRMPLSHQPSSPFSLPTLQLVSGKRLDSILAHMLSQILYSHRYSNGSFQLLLLTSHGFLTRMQADTENTYKFDVKVAFICTYCIPISLSVHR